jgi:biopolymer transport protein TolQ
MFFSIDMLCTANALYAFAESSIIGKIIVIGLAVGSVVVWTFMISKSAQLKDCDRQNAKFYHAYNRYDNPLTLYQQNKAFNGSPAYGIYVNSCKELTKIIGVNGDDIDLFMGVDPEKELSLSAKQMRYVKNNTESVLADSILILEKNMSVLASASTVAPFLGLLGTVWGVMEAFAGMAATGSALLSEVAPGISSALLTTIVGLVVALPSSIGYNILGDRIRSHTVGLENFVVRLVGDLEQNYLAKGE